MLRLLFIVLMIYLTYKVIFHLVIPIYKTTRQVKKGFREMQEQMRKQQQNQSSNQTPGQASTTSKKEPAGDYIDFEEIK
jgi:Sec-independent protein translocase protein TatA